MTERPPQPLLSPVVLTDGLVRLRPLESEDVAALDEALCDGELPRLFYTGTSIEGGALAMVEDALLAADRGQRSPFVVEDASTGLVVGSTSFYDPEPTVPRLAIGYTWYRAGHRGGATNPACKRLLLTHAFETLGCEVVQFHTDRFNLRSQRAIERLGATREGVLRSHQRRSDGGLRDTVCYSILASEWPDVKRLLDLRRSPTAP